MFLRPITRALRKHGVDVITAQEDGTARWSDPDLLDRAAELDRVLFSQDEDLLVEAARRQRQGVVFKGVIYAPQLALTTGGSIRAFGVVGKGWHPGGFCKHRSISAFEIN